MERDDGVPLITAEFNTEQDGGEGEGRLTGFYDSLENSRGIPDQEASMASS